MKMNKVSNGIVSLAILAALATALIVPATASLISTGFGFPVISRSGQSTSFSDDFASFTDSESINIDFLGGFMPLTFGTGSLLTPGVSMPDMGHVELPFDFRGFNFF
jgi:hypothetical protein